MIRRRLAGALALVTLAAAGCTSSSGGGTTPTTAAPVSSGTPAPTTAPAPTTSPVTTPSTSAAPTVASSTAPSTRPTSLHPSSARPTPTTPAPSTSRPGPTTTATLTPPPPGGGTCRASQLRVTSARGGASQGREYAAVVLTNVSSSACTMRGYPAAQLLHAGALLGNPAGHDTLTPVRTQTVRPRGSVQAVLSAVSTCQSPLSDHVRVIVPGQTAPLDTAIQLRACGLTIGPVDLP